MNNKGIATILLFACLAIPMATEAKVDKPAKDWQLKSLKGIATIQYGVTFDPDGSLLKLVESELKGLKCPMKSMVFKDCAVPDLAKNEACLKVYIDNREKDLAWVGIAIQQKSELARNTTVTYNADTYSIGSLCPRSKSKEMIKELCAKFQEDFKANK